MAIAAAAVVGLSGPASADQCEDFWGQRISDGDQLWAAQLGCASGVHICQAGKASVGAIMRNCAQNCAETSGANAKFCTDACVRQAVVYQKCSENKFDESDKWRGSGQSAGASLADRTRCLEPARPGDRQANGFRQVNDPPH